MKKIIAKVLKPKEFSGVYGYSINGVESKEGYVSNHYAKVVMNRELEKINLSSNNPVK